MIVSKLSPDRVDAHRRAEAATGFPLLKSCPNTSAIHLLRILESMSPDELDELLEQLAQNDEFNQFPAQTAEAHAEHMARLPALTKLRKARGVALNFRTVSTLPVKTVAGSLKEPQVGGDPLAWARFLHLPDEAAEFTTQHASSVEDLVPIKPRSLRNKLKKITGERFNADSEKLSAESTRYTGTSGDWKVAIDVAFVSNKGWRRQHQFGYLIWLGSPNGGRIQVPSYESLWDISSEWDYVTDENADRSISALCNLVERTIDIAS